MMNNMFSMFDPSSSYYSISWMIILTPIILMTMSVHKKSSKTIKLMNKALKNMKKEMEDLMGKNKKNFSSNLMMMLFLLIMTTNLMALIPFNFTATAHLSISIPISLSMWLSIMMYGWFNSFKSMMSHMTPMGTPNNLMNFMVIIELISNMIRPITLSVRLSANMVAGHLLVSLLSNFSMINPKNTLMSMAFMMVLSTLELVVALVQAYVLATLLTLYHNESM